MQLPSTFLELLASGTALSHRTALRCLHPYEVGNVGWLLLHSSLQGFLCGEDVKEEHFAVNPLGISRSRFKDHRGHAGDDIMPKMMRMLSQPTHLLTGSPRAAGVSNLCNGSRLFRGA